MVVVAMEVVMVVVVQRWYGQEGAPSGVGVEVRQPMVAVNINRNNENDQVRLGFYASFSSHNSTPKTEGLCDLFWLVLSSWPMLSAREQQLHVQCQLISVLINRDPGFTNPYYTQSTGGHWSRLFLHHSSGFSISWSLQALQWVLCIQPASKEERKDSREYLTGDFRDKTQKG